MLNSPETDKASLDARSRLYIAALDCIKRHGFGKTTMSDIAQEAGLARPTLYKHFKSKTEALFAGIDTMALAFAESIVANARQFDTYEERFVETIVYTVQEFPKHPYLSLVFDHECSLLFRERAFADEATMVFSEMTAAPLIELKPELADQGVEITELMSRFALSMILFPGKFAHDDNALRELIRTRLLPGMS